MGQDRYINSIGLIRTFDVPERADQAYSNHGSFEDVCSPELRIMSGVYSQNQATLLLPGSTDTRYGAGPQTRVMVHPDLRGETVLACTAGPLRFL